MTQQPILGFFLALTAAIMWSALPIALQPVLSAMDAQTIVWFRFVVATIGVFLWLLCSKKLPKPTALRRQDWLLLFIGVVGLSANFFLFNLSLKYIPATASQVLSPISSFSMLISGIFIFKERLGLHQKIGLALLIIGLTMFFNNRFADFTAMNQFALGIFIGISASLIWVLYGLAQKMLSARFTAQQILLMIYLGCAIVMTPFSEISQTQNLSEFAAYCLLFCCLNTVLAYGCYGEALSRWEVSKVSMILPQIPILTLIFSELAHFAAPQHFPHTELNLISYIGSIIVVLGALSAAAGHKIFNKKRT